MSMFYVWLNVTQMVRDKLLQIYFVNTLHFISPVSPSSLLCPDLGCHLPEPELFRL